MTDKTTHAMGVIIDQLHKAKLEIGTLNRVISILVTSLHGQGTLDGRNIARAIRLDHASDEEFRLALADLIDRSIEQRETQGGVRPRPVE